MRLFQIILFFGFSSSLFTQPLYHVPLKQPSFSSLKHLESFNSCASKRLVLFGEKHRMEGNYEGQLLFLKHLNRTHKTRIVIIEYGASVAWLINAYLKSGKEKDLEKIKWSVFAEGDFFQWVRELHKFNRKLPPDKKLIVIGADLEMQSSAALHVLNELWQDPLPDTTIAAFREDLMQFCNNDTIHRKTADQLALSITQNYRTYSIAYQQSLGIHYDTFKEILEGLETALQYYKIREVSKEQAYQYREPILTRKLEQCLDKYPKEKFFGQLGQLHVTLKSTQNWVEIEHWESMAARLEQNTNVKNQVCSTLIIYSGNVTEHDSLIISDAVVKEEQSGQWILFNVANEKSPYHHSNDLFHYVLLNQFSSPE